MAICNIMPNLNPRKISFPKFSPPYIVEDYSYNIITLIEIVDLPTWNVALFFIPFANIYITFKVYIELAKKFGKGAGYGVGLVFIFPILGAILAFDNSKYEVSNNYQNSVEQNNMGPNPQAIQQENYCPNCGAKSATSDTYCPYCGSKK